MKKRERKRLDDLSKWRAEMMGRYGGFGHRYIASYIFGKPLARVGQDDISCVSSYLHRIGVRVVDWRQGRTSVASEYADHVTRYKRRRKTA